MRSAIVGGVAGGFLWATTATIFTSFIAGSANRQAIYASLAVAISALIWLYLNWIILLIGSQIAFYFQNPAYLRIGRRDPRLSNEMRERVALNVMYLVGREHRNPDAGVDLHSISRALRIPSITLAPIALGLETKGLLTTNEKEMLLPGKEMSRIPLQDILSVVRQEVKQAPIETSLVDNAINLSGALSTHQSTSLSVTRHWQTCLTRLKSRRSWCLRRELSA